MPEEDTILEIEPAWRREIEDMGSKPKFWFRYQDTMWLFKQARPNTGEHWAEKVASEIATLLGLATHKVLIARYEGRTGCAVRSFLGRRQSLVHGNELLAGAIDGYDKSKHRGQSDHNFENIVRALEHKFADPKRRQTVSVNFAGYLMLDALVGNTDRHHENWGVVQKTELHYGGEPRRLSIRMLTDLAPTFDHASSLGRELLDERRQCLLNDASALTRYIRKGHGGIFREAEARRGLAPIVLAELLAERYPKLCEPWKRRIAELPKDFALPLLERIPSACMSPLAREFVVAFLMESRKMILTIP